ncbi:hypothetical protein LSAT2_023939 [Lamellibrachia satsuma]|nr:hypothetical protein LSAT2_023939 [Lamellibrachia satsuma]
MKLPKLRNGRAGFELQSFRPKARRSDALPHDHRAPPVTGGARSHHYVVRYQTGGSLQNALLQFSMQPVK